MSASPRAPVPLPACVGESGSLPEYSTTGAAGADLRASEAVTIAPGARTAVPTALRLQIPAGHVGLVWPRSGLAVRHGIDTLAGVVDSDYRGEVRVVLVNHGDEPFRIEKGDRIAPRSRPCPRSTRRTAARAASARAGASQRPRPEPGARGYDALTSSGVSHRRRGG
jgi:dUTP pyrophosphatase